MKKKLISLITGIWMVIAFPMIASLSALPAHAASIPVPWYGCWGPYPIYGYEFNMPVCEGDGQPEHAADSLGLCYYEGYRAFSPGADGICHAAIGYFECQQAMGSLWWWSMMILGTDICLGY